MRNALESPSGDGERRGRIKAEKVLSPQIMYCFGSRQHCFCSYVVDAPDMTSSLVPTQSGAQPDLYLLTTWLTSGIG
jgi:hypothetical protein